MLTIHLPREACQVITAACRRAGVRETGGMLFGEHFADREFKVVEATVAGTGLVASFVRSVGAGLSRLDAFFRRTRHDYKRFNYLGEWHSHPSFALHPSTTDDYSMFEIVNDPSTSARFVVSLIVRLDDDMLSAAAFTYFPGGDREPARVVLDAGKG